MARRGGLLQLWLIASMLWVSNIGFLTWGAFPTVNEPARYRPAECTGKNDDECVAIPEHVGKNPFDAFEQTLNAEQQKAIREGALSAFLPPAFALLIGSALVLAFRAFRA